jgi:hypothetical protein
MKRPDEYPRAKEITLADYFNMAQPERDAWMHNMMLDLQDEGTVKVLGPGLYEKIANRPKVLS